MHNGFVENNIVTLVGEVIKNPVFSHKVYNEGFYTFDLEVTRLSNATDTLPIIISERIIDRADLVIGKTIRLTGQIRSYNNYIESEQRSRLVITVFARDYTMVEESSNLNEVFLNGFICKPPIYRETPLRREIADILIAVNRPYNRSDYIPCILWGRNARFSNKLNVSDNIKVWGRMQSRHYQKKYENGVELEKIAFEVSVSKIEVPILILS